MLNRRRHQSDRSTSKPRGQTPASSTLQPITKPGMIDGKQRRSSATELPPIDTKSSSPSYASRSPHELSIDGQNRTRTRRSPLSPTSTASSHGGSSHSNHRSSLVGQLPRSKTNIDLSSSLHSAGRLETLYEMTHGQPLATTTGAPKLRELTITETGNGRLNLLPTKDPLKPSKSTRTLVMKKSQSAGSLPITPAETARRAQDGASPTLLKESRLSVENLMKLKLGSSSQDGRRVKETPADAGYDTDEEKEQRIVKWLIGVESSQAEEPPEVTSIATEEKTDTAIHIVYEGD